MSKQNQKIKILKDKEKVYEGRSYHDSVCSLLGLMHYLVSHTSDISNLYRNNDTREVYDKSLELLGLLSKLKRGLDNA